MKHGPDIPSICGGEVDTFSRRYRRMRAKFVHAGDNAYWKRKYQRRSRAIAKRELRMDTDMTHDPKMLPYPFKEADDTPASVSVSIEATKEKIREAFAHLKPVKASLKRPDEVARSASDAFHPDEDSA